MISKTNNRFHYFVLVLYFLSGLASLAYEILWVRMLSLEFGVSIFGVVITVSVFMLGLGLGSLLGLTLLRQLRNPLFFFAGLEMVISVFSILIPELFQLSSDNLSAIGEGSLSIWYSWQFVVTGVILLVPALLMGTGFPVILNVCKNLESSLAVIYGTNTLGAATGSILPLVLLPAVGWSNSLYIVAGISMFIALFAWVVSIKTAGDSKFEETQSVGAIKQGSIRFLLAYAGIGAAALMLEIGWTRLFGMLFLRTEYVLGIILAVFLVGTALGSYLSRKHLQERGLVFFPIVAALSIIAGLWFLPAMVSIFTTQHMTSFSRVLVTQSILIVIITLPVTVIFGAWLPLLNNKLGSSGLSGARLYGVNSIGASLGSLVAGFLIIPLVGTYALIQLAGMLLIIFSMAWVARKQSLIYLCLVVLAGIPVLRMVPVNELMPDRYSGTRDLYFNEDALNITHVVEQQDGQRLLLADLQRMDAASDPDSVHSQRNQGRLPVLLHPGAREVLYLGMGTGVSISPSLAYKNLHRTAVELSEGAIEATNNYFTSVNNNVSNYSKIIRDDARRFLKSSKSQFDVVVGDLFHPDLVGRSALLSRQQFQRAKDHLNSDGIFVQWIALNQFDLNSMNIVLRTFKQVFPEAVMFLDAYRLALVGINGKMHDPETLLAKFKNLNDEDLLLATGGESIFTWLGRYWGQINAGNSGDIQDEWEPKIEFRLPQARYNGQLNLAILINELLRQRPHVTAAVRELNIPDQHREEFERAYIGTELGHRSWLALLQNDGQEGHRLLKLAYQANPEDYWVKSAVADATLENYDATTPEGVTEEELLQAVLRIQPNHSKALKRLWLMYQRNGNTQKALQFKTKFAKVSPYDKSLLSQ